MSNSDMHDLSEPSDDLAVARHAFAVARERLMQLEHQVRRARDDIEYVRDSVGSEVESDIRKRLEQALHDLSFSTSPRGVRIDGEFHVSGSVTWATHELLGLWRPSVPPQSPQELGCTAIICSCATLLRNPVQIRQHWEAGCFDMPHYATITRRTLADIERELFAEVEAEEQELRTKTKEDV